MKQKFSVVRNVNIFSLYNTRPSSFQNQGNAVLFVNGNFLKF